MPRYAAETAYEGGSFCGWQIQPGQPSVQQALEEALTLLNGGERVSVVGAGRTDAGVHARGQVCSFDLRDDWQPRKLLLALNANLPAGASALRICRARPDFHARFDAVSREYMYFIWNASSIYPQLRPNVCWLKASGYDWSRAAAACRLFEGTHDFGAFCRAVDRPDDAVRTICKARLSRSGHLLKIHVVGSGFLTNMVRIMTGCLELVARGEKEPRWIEELLSAQRVRADCGRTMPPQGLFLWRINYDPPLWN